MKYSNNLLIRNFAAIDVETTGLSTLSGGRVIEIGAVLIEDGAIIGEFKSLINIGKIVPKEATRIHGITTKMLDNQPKASDVMPRFLKFIKNSVLIAHNSKFDIRFINHELSMLNLRLLNKHFCTLKMSRSLFPYLPNHRLQTVAQHLLGKLSREIQLHRALDDAMLVARMWMEMQKK